ncbi:MAG: class IIb bacteriocin, lactobin A/cerein 7B family [Balneolaceae bacterium]
MKTLNLEQMEQVEGGDVCAAITGGAVGTGWAAAVGGGIANGAKFGWRLGLKGLAVGVIGGALAGGTCYLLS